MTLHQQHQQQTLNLRIVENATSHIPTGIVHCEDHFPNSDAINATFLDESAFRQLHTQHLTHHLNTYNNITKLLPQYKWVPKEWGGILASYILPKAKKQYATGRPSVSFMGAMM